MEIEIRGSLFPTEQSFEIETQKPLSPIEQSSEIEKLVAYLTILLENWNKSPNIVVITQPKKDLDTSEEDKEEDPMRILYTKINSANAVDQDQFANST